MIEVDTWMHRGGDTPAAQASADPAADLAALTGWGM